MLLELAAQRPGKSLVLPQLDAKEICPRSKNKPTMLFGQL